jgi:hypothetical protein
MTSDKENGRRKHVVPTPLSKIKVIMVTIMMTMMMMMMMTRATHYNVK